VNIEEVDGAPGRNEFIRFPWKVYQGNAHWVPPLKSDVAFHLNENKNPFFHHAEAACFLARKNGETVGRIAAIIDRKHIEFHAEPAGFFGFFECLPDCAVARQLLDTAASWLKERDIEIMRGPMNPSTNDECGFLLDGFDSPPMIMMPYTPAYYLGYMEHCGLTKAKDLYAYSVVIGDVDVADHRDIVQLVQIPAAVRGEQHLSGDATVDEPLQFVPGPVVVQLGSHPAIAGVLHQIPR
jgi:hypothetical protein